MFVRRKAVKVFVEFASKKLSEATIDEQIVIWQALSKAMASREERARAAEIAQALSRAAALQTDFTRQLFTGFQRPDKGDGHGDGDGHRRKT